MNLLLEKELDGLVEDISTTVLYYEAEMCSCVAENGVPDPNDNCVEGWRYKPSVKYNLLRTQVNEKDKAGESGFFLSGGASFSIPRTAENHHAVVVSTNLSTGIDLSTYKNIKIQIDGQAATEIDCSSGAVSSSSVTTDEIVNALNAGGLGKIAYKSGKDGNPSQSGYVTLRSNELGTSSVIIFLPPAADDATTRIFGIMPPIYPKYYSAKTSGLVYIPLYVKVSRGDVFVLENRTITQTDFLKKGSRDDIRAFDVKRIIVLKKKGTEYKKGIDYNLNGSTVSWIGSGTAPSTGEDYTVKYETLTNYIVFQDQADSRGADNDFAPRRITCALRNYIRLSPSPIDSLTWGEGDKKWS